MGSIMIMKSYVKGHILNLFITLLLIILKDTSIKMLSENSQKEKDKYWMISPVRDINKMKEQMKLNWNKP